MYLLYQQFFDNQKYININFIVILITFVSFLKFIFSYFTKKTNFINSSAIQQPINNKMRKTNYYTSLETCPRLQCPTGYKNVTEGNIETCNCADGFAIVTRTDKYNNTCAPICDAGYEHKEYQNNLICVPICQSGYVLVNKNGKFTCECRTLKCPVGFEPFTENNIQTCKRIN